MKSLMITDADSCLYCDDSARPNAVYIDVTGPADGGPATFGHEKVDCLIAWLTAWRAEHP